MGEARERSEAGAGAGKEAGREGRAATRRVTSKAAKGKAGGERKGRARRDSYDAACKQLIARTPVLALILKNTAPEFEGKTLEEVARCIGGVRAGEVPVDEREALPPSLPGMRNEDDSLDDGPVFFDTLFRTRLPGGGSAAMTVNVETQSEPDPGNPLTKRGSYYVSRILSSQRRNWPSGSDYGRLEKAYSIWVCVDFPEEDAGTATSYDMRENNLLGHRHRPREEYDTHCVVLLCLPKEDGAGAARKDPTDPDARPGMEGFMDALATVFSPKTDAVEKMKALESQLGPEEAGKLKGDVKRMGSLEEYAIQIGAERTKFDDIVRIMKNLSLSLDEAFRALEVPKSEQDAFRNMLATR